MRDADDAMREAQRRAASERRFGLPVENSADVIAHVRDGRYANRPVVGHHAPDDLDS